MILAIDQGTTGTTVLLVDENGVIINRAYREITQHYPKPGWVEHDPIEILHGIIDLSEYLIKESPKPIEAIGVVNQRETIVLWNKNTGKPVHNAIVWQDRRTSDICKSLKQDEPFFRRRTGLLIDPYFSGTKLKWLLDSDKKIRSDAESGSLLAGTIDTWLVWNLTSGETHATDITNASRTLCCNIHSGEWDDELLEKLNLPKLIFPTIYPSKHLFGKCNHKSLPKGIPIGGIAGDQQAALFGQGCIETGLVKNTYGTGCFLLSFCGESPQIPEEPVLVTSASSGMEKQAYAYEGAVFNAGSSVKWLRDKVHLIDNSSETESIAESIPHTSGVYVVPAFTGLGAPYWDADARGAVIGLTLGSGKKEIVRAVLESIAYQTADLLTIPSLKENLTELRVDGGACQNDFLMQFQADILGIPVNRPKYIETTALGAAYLAGLEVGVWSDTKEIENLRQVDRIFEPKISEDKKEELIFGWKSAVERVLSNKSPSI